MTRNTCYPEPLAEGSVVRVEHCAGCRTLSLHFGAITIRVDARAARSLHDTLADALAELRRLGERGELPEEGDARFGHLSS